MSRTDQELGVLVARYGEARSPEETMRASKDMVAHLEKKSAAEVGRPALYAPADVDLENARWNANCGPAALAAAIESDIAPLRACFPQFPQKAYTTLTQMKEALDRLGRRFSARALRRVEGELPTSTKRALVQIQWTGPWTEAGANPRWACLHTHWITVVGAPDTRLWVYDVNADHETISGDPRLSVLRASGGGWIQASDWIRFIVPVFLEAIPRSTGFFCRYQIEVMP